ncbi:hypothetical protein [Anaerovorax sp. IOR16]|uniref:hypothetical protein n=1 Tax=Anaerovorax sp. IOR16 TaxID=2773458 RepID=UPI0019D0333C|nr:hypothetical protein [Anaerovorax sp. IOR16]
MNELKYSDLQKGQKVFVEYEKDGCVWMEETRECIHDGIETVKKDEEGRLYTIDAEGSILTDLEHYLEIGGIKIYAFNQSL